MTENRRGSNRLRLFFFGDTPCEHKALSKPTIDLLYVAGIASFEHEEWFAGG